MPGPALERLTAHGTALAAPGAANKAKDKALQQLSMSALALPQTPRPRGPVGCKGLPRRGHCLQCTGGAGSRGQPQGKALSPAACGLLLHPALPGRPLVGWQRVGTNTGALKRILGCCTSRAARVCSWARGGSRCGGVRAASTGSRAGISFQAMQPVGPSLTACARRPTAASGLCF